MKNFINKKVAALAMMFAVAAINPANGYSNVNSDTLKHVATEDSFIGPDNEDVVEETTLELEDWMFEPISTEKEETLNIEDWMSEKISFDAEEKLEIEDWMSEKISFDGEEKLEIEDWMSDPDYLKK